MLESGLGGGDDSLTLLDGRPGDLGDVPEETPGCVVWSYPCRVMHCLELSIQLPLSMALKYWERAHRMALETQETAAGVTSCLHVSHVTSL